MNLSRLTVVPRLAFRHCYLGDIPSHGVGLYSDPHCVLRRGLCFYNVV